MVCDTPLSQDTFKHQIWRSYLKENRRYAPDSMQFLETRSEVKFKNIVTQLRYVTFHHPKMHSHTNFRFLPQIIKEMCSRHNNFKKLGHRSSTRSQLPNNGLLHFLIPRCIITSNLRLLAQIILEICPGHNHSKN